jgi:hypothetical protein
MARKRLRLQKERLTELAPQELASMAAGMKATIATCQTNLSCGIVQCTRTLQADCVVA